MKRLFFQSSDQSGRISALNCSSGNRDNEEIMLTRWVAESSIVIGGISHI